MNEAIKLAIKKGGYTFGEFFRTSFENGGMKWRFIDNNTVQIWSLVNVDITPSLTWEYPFSKIVQDPFFWQALGKALGWRENLWLFVALEYTKEVLTGGDTEKFWKELIAVSNDRQ